MGGDRSPGLIAPEQSASDDARGVITCGLRPTTRSLTCPVALCSLPASPRCSEQPSGWVRAGVSRPRALAAPGGARTAFALLTAASQHLSQVGPRQVHSPEHPIGEVKLLPLRVAPGCPISLVFLGRFWKRTLYLCSYFSVWQFMGPFIPGQETKAAGGGSCQGQALV